jgi:catechol 2,3-dioxygenase-like lactoylglutathione lyase family enzyme
MSTEPTAPGRVTGFFHAGITVRDMDDSLRFYRDVLGLETHFDTVLDGPYLPVVLALDVTTIRAVYLVIPGGGFVELLEYRDLERMSAASRPCDYGAGHLCFYVEGIDDVVARAHAAGFRTRSDGPVDITAGPNAGARSVYLLDPDGYPVELFQRPPGASS